MVTEAARADAGIVSRCPWRRAGSPTGCAPSPDRGCGPRAARRPGGRPDRGLGGGRRRCRAGGAGLSAAHRRASSTGRDLRRIRGGLVADLERGCVVAPRVAARAGAEAIDLAPVESLAAGRRLTITTVDRIVSTVAEKQRLAAETAADVVDMETWAVAREAIRAGLPCQCIRVVSDAATDSLPPEIARLTEAPSPWRRLGEACAPSAAGRLPPPTSGGSTSGPSSTRARWPTGARARVCQLPAPAAVRVSSRTSAACGRSGVRAACGRPLQAQTASAAIRPLRTAPSIVEGQPVAVQSPARNRFGTRVREAGRDASTPGRTESTAVGSVTTRLSTSAGHRAAGNTSREFRDDALEQQFPIPSEQPARGADHHLAVARPSVARRGETPTATRVPRAPHGAGRPVAVKPQVHGGDGDPANRSSAGGTRSGTSRAACLQGTATIAASHGSVPAACTTPHMPPEASSIPVTSQPVVDDGPAAFEPADEPLAEEHAERLHRHEQVGRGAVGRKASTATFRAAGTLTRSIDSPSALSSTGCQKSSIDPLGLARWPGAIRPPTDRPARRHRGSRASRSMPDRERSLLGKREMLDERGAGERGAAELAASARACRRPGRRRGR